MAEFDVKGLKAGDRVGVTGPYPHQRQLTAVARVTPSGQIVTATAGKYRPDGTEMGTSYRIARRLADPSEVAAQMNGYEAGRALKGAFFALEKMAYDLLKCRRHTDEPEPLTPAERAELLALIDRCSGPTATTETT